MVACIKTGQKDADGWYAWGGIAKSLPGTGQLRRKQIFGLYGNTVLRSERTDGVRGKHCGIIVEVMQTQSWMKVS